MESFRLTWNEHAKILPKISELTPNRKRALRRLASKRPNLLAEFTEAVQIAADSVRLNGLRATEEYSFIASFDWLIRESNLVKVLEGTYGATLTDERDVAEGQAWARANKAREAEL